MAKNKEDEALYKAEGERRIKVRKQKRRDAFIAGHTDENSKKYRNKYGYCEMGYSDCMARGYCNGDC